MIDMTYYETVAEGDHNFIMQMVKTFLEDVPVMLNDINEKRKRDDFNALSKTIHKLKPAWSMSGLDVLVLNAAEAAIKSASGTDDIDKKLNAIHVMAGIALEEMEIKYKEIKAASNDINRKTTSH